MTKSADLLKGLRLFFTFAGLFTLLGATVTSTDGYAVQQTNKAVILVLPFQVTPANNSQQVDNDFSTQIANQIASHGVRVVPNQRVINLLQSRKIETLDSTTARALARSAGATHALFGSINKAGNTLSIDARLVSASNGSVKPFFVDPVSGNITTATTTLASRISGEFAAKGSVTAVEVRGTKALDPEVILMRVSTHVGDSLNPVIIDEDIKKIWDLGYFTDVQVTTEPRNNGAALIYNVVELPRIESVSVEGANAISQEDVISVMSTKTGSILNEKMLTEDIQKIIEQYRKKGYYLAKVNQRRSSLQDGSTTALTITIDEGKKLYITQVKIKGTQQLSESDVKSTMLMSERSIISWITGTGVLKEDLIERDSSAITSYYLDRGFLDVVVQAPDIAYEEEGISVTFPIVEGERYRLGKVAFAGDLIDTDERLSSITTLDNLAAKNEYFNLSVMQEDAQKLTEFYAEYGFAYANVNPVPEKAGKTVNITYQIEKGNKYYVGRVSVTGNNKTRDNVILREMRLTDGDTFTGSKLRRSNERLNRLGIFETAEVELVPTNKPDEVDLKVHVKERPTGSLMGGVGYSTFSNVGVAATLMERNLFGKGYSTSLQASFSGRRNAYTYSFTNPRLNDTDLSVGFDLYNMKDDYIDYEKRTSGGILRAAYPLGEYTSLGVGYRFDVYRMYDFEKDASPLVKKYDTGQRYSSVGLLRLTRDTTDSAIPTKGNIDAISFDYGGGALGGDDHFFTVGLEHQTFYQLWKDHVLHGKIKGAAIYKNSSHEIPVFERFWLGGIGTIRGYDSRHIVPRDKASNERIGGTRMAYTNLEYIWSFDNELGLSLVPFFDAGFNIDMDNTYTWKDEIFKSYGLEMRWRSPLGDLRFSYGIPLDKDRRGKKESGRFEFSMGSTF